MNLRSLCYGAIALLTATSPLMSQIETGTSVRITIQGVPSEEKVKVDGFYPVSESGTINLPLIGRMRAVGLRPESLALAIQSAYRTAQIYSNPTIQVVSTAEGGEVREQLVHIGGQVRRPGPTKFTKNLTIFQAVQAAGGATEFGSLRRVKLYRNGKTKMYDLTDTKDMRIKLQQDDTIDVPQKDWLGR